jgi:peptide/nickel transport system substrate-binding protein
MGRQIPRRAFLARAGSLGALGLLSACGTLSPLSVGTQTAPAPAHTLVSTPEPRRGGTLRIAKPEDILLGAFPYLLAPANFQLSNLVYDTLVVYDRQLNPQPRLATSWTWSADFRQLTLQLRQGVRFHTGRPFTSDDAKFNLERLRDPSAGSQLRGYAESMHIAAPSPDTLVITYDAPLKSSFDALYMTYMADPQTFDQMREGRQFVGTGPFSFHEWVPGDHLAVRRNPDYWRPGKPYLDGVEVRVLPDRQAALIALETGSIDWLTAVPGQDARRLLTDPAYQVQLTGNGGLFYMLGMDVTTPELADKRVRQAFGFALNRQRMVDTSLSGFGRPASIPWPRQSLPYSESLDAYYRYDLTHARQLLSESGWKDETVLPLFVVDTLAITGQMAEVLQADLASIGVRSVIHKLGQPDFVSRLVRGQFAGAWILTVSWMHLSPATMFNTAFPMRVPNSSNFVSTRYQMLIQQALSATDDQTLQQMLVELTQIVLDEAFVVMIAEGAAQQSGPEVVRSTVRNVTTDRFGLNAYEDVWLAQ